MRFMNRLFPALLATSMGIHAAGWTVSEADSTANFQTLQPAIDNAAVGDTLYLADGRYSGQIGKRLVVVGLMSVPVPPSTGASGTIGLRAGSDGTKIVGMAKLDVQFADNGISGVEIAHCVVSQLTGNGVRALWYHNNRNSGTMYWTIQGTGIRFENSAFFALDVSGSGNLVRHASMVGIRGDGVLIDSSVSPSVTSECTNCMFQNSIIPDKNAFFPNYNSYRNILPSTDTIHLAGVGDFITDPTHRIGPFGGQYPLVFEADGSLRSNPQPFLAHVNLDHGQVATTDSVKIWVRAWRPANGGK